MQSSKVLLVGVLVIAVGYLVEGINITVTTSNVAPRSSPQNSSSNSVTSSPTTPTTTKSSATSGSVKKVDSDEDCDDEPIAEPEGKTNATRQGKELNLTDKDKYTHDNATAEPEAEGASGTKDKLTGANGTTTISPSRGGASATFGSSCFVLGVAIFTTVFMKISV